MKKHGSDLIWGLFFILVGACIIIFKDLLIVGKYAKNAADPSAFPVLMSWFMIITGLTMVIPAIITLLKECRSNNEKAVPFKDSLVALVKSEWRVVAFMGLAILYVVFYEKLGYFITSFIVTTLVLLLFKAKKKSYYIATYVAVVILFCAFRFGLSAQLPLGTWFGF